MTSQKEVKKENFATIAEAIAGAGTDVLSHLGDERNNDSKLNVKQVEEYEKDLGRTGRPLEGEYRAYAGPYHNVEDQRNSWIAAQESGQPSRTRAALPEDRDEERRQAKPQQQPPEPAKKNYEPSKK